ncbi:MAG: hypothetical protein AB7U82_29175 [Blastocatellales bacterium]
MKLSPAGAKSLFSLALGVVSLSLAILVCVIGLSPDDSRLTERPPAEIDEGEGPRGSWFYAQRAYPLKTIPHAARVRALDQLEREERRLRELYAASPHEFPNPEAQLSWAALGPAPIGEGQTFGVPRVAVSGRVSAVALDQGYNGTSNQTVYIGAAQGGVWRSRDNGSAWAPLTDDQPSLAMGAIAIDPTNPNIIYAGTGEAHLSGDSYYGAGLLKSVDGGAMWTRITGPVSARDPKLPAFLNATFHTLAIDPAAPSTIYAATEEGTISSASGVTDIAPLGDQGIWKSTDGGMTWRNLNPPNLPALNKSGTDALLDPRNTSRVFAAMYGLGVYRSNNGGEPGAWQKLAGGLPGSGFARIKLAAGPPRGPSADSTLYAAFASDKDELLGIWSSTDGGGTWTKATTPQTLGQANYNLTLAVDPVDANIVYYGTSANAINSGGTLWRSRDGGQTWTDLSGGNGASGGLHADTHWIAISPTNRNILFTANDGGVWRTDSATDNVVTWTSLNQTLNITQFYTIALHPTDQNILLGGTQDNGTNRYNGGANWFQSRGGDGGAVLIDQSNPQVMYHTFFNRNNADGQRPQIGPEISLNGGNSWARRGCFGCVAQPGGFNPADRTSQYAPMALHSGFAGASGNVIYFGTHRLYRSADQGVTWTGLGASADGFGADLTKNAPAFPSGFPSYISAIAAHPALDQSVNPPDADGEIVWVGTGDGLVQVTTNAGALSGATFSNVTKSPLPNRYVTDIALDPNNKLRAIVSYSGFNTNTPATPGHVFTTEDQGATWRDISGNLPDTPVNSVAIDPVFPGTLFIGTDLGVFQTTDGGATWIRLGNGLPKVAAFVTRYHAATRSLIAATHGRGVYRLTLPSRAVASVSAASFSRTGLAPEAIASAFGTGLATTTQVATTQPLPTTLAGTRILIRDSAGVERFAPLFFVSPGQVNYQIPPGTVAGTAVVTIAGGDGVVSIGGEQIALVAPGLFAANANGQGAAAAVAVRVKSDGSQIFEPVTQFDAAQNRFVTIPIDLGPPSETVVFVLFGTGLRNRSAQSAVSVKLGGADAPVLYASVAPGFVGLDQVNIAAPRSLIGRGEIDAALAADGKAANTVRINIR